MSDSISNGNYSFNFILQIPCQLNIQKLYSNSKKINYLFVIIIQNSTIMKKEQIRINEAQLRSIVSESLKKVIREMVSENKISRKTNKKA